MDITPYDKLAHSMGSRKTENQLTSWYLMTGRIPEAERA